IITGSGSIYILLGGITGTKVLKLKSNGKIDTSFGSGGMSVVDVNHDEVLGLGAVTFAYAGGKILIAGLISNGDFNEIAKVFRLNSNGSLDTTFGVNGSVQFQLGITDKSFPDTVDRVAAIGAQSDGKITLVGSSINWYPEQPNPFLDPTLYGNAYLVAARLTSSGKFDKSYGTNGISRAQIPAGQILLRSGGPEIGDTFAYSSNSVGTINADGSALVVGDALQLSAAKFDPRGKIVFNTTVTPGFQLNTPTAITTLPDGRSIVSGVPSPFYVGHGPALVELFADGTFGPYRLTDDLKSSTVELIDDNPMFGNDQYAHPHPIAIAPDGQLLVGGGPKTGSGFEIEKFQVGNASDPLPNVFPGGTANSLKLDKDMGLHLAYFDANSKTLKYAYRAINGQWSAPVTVDSTPYAGTYLSLAVDSNDQPAIAYFDAEHGDLKFANSTNLGKTWKTQTIDSKGSTGLYPSLVINSSSDGNGQVMIAYYRKTSGDLRFASEKPDGSWGIENIDAAGNVGRSCELYQTYNDETLTPIVVYSDSTTNEIKFGTYQKGGKWLLQTVAKTKGGADFYSIDWARYSPAISFYDAYSGDLNLAYREDPTTDIWSGLVPVSTKGIVGLYSAAAFYDLSDTTEHVQVYAYDKSTDSVSLYTDAEQPPEPIVPMITNGGRYLSVARDPSLQIGAGDAAYLDSKLNALRVETVLSPIDDITQEAMPPED
ncbi:MAG TPA: delta-60 repeat domain-containing protein, partial [Tepidisphaeraceae bacterium]|nr:delta-60 repeat domain-containing protein [Tepidisphaeraceae bacterium]